MRDSLPGDLHQICPDGRNGVRAYANFLVMSTSRVTGHITPIFKRDGMYVIARVS